MIEIERLTEELRIRVSQVHYIINFQPQISVAINIRKM